MGMDQLDDLLGTGLPSGLDLGEDQFAIDGDLVHASLVRDQFDGLYLIPERVLQVCRYPSGYRAVVSNIAVADLYLHADLPVVCFVGRVYHTHASWTKAAGRLLMVLEHVSQTRTSP